ncbi:MAG: hypothetical protein ABR976_07960 [Terracidiphilus sp.]|jgi:hypothetical protein
MLSALWLRVVGRGEEILTLAIPEGNTEKMQRDRGQFSWLLRHFLERFFNHETASPDGDAKTRLVQVALGASMPGFVFALYLWHPYHPIVGPLPPYWTQAGDRFFYVVYSFVVMGVVTVFEWDLFFPDLLDVFVLSNLPIKNRMLFLARIAAILILVVSFLFDANLLGVLALPAATDPPDIWRFLGGYMLGVGMSGVFATAMVLALQAVLISVLGERLFRKVSLFLQGFLIAVLVMLLLLFPVVSGTIGAFMLGTNGYAFYFPPFWFLAMYQRVMEGPTALPIYEELARTGLVATLGVGLTACVFYPVAYWRRTNQLVEGLGTRDTRNWAAAPVDAVTHATVARTPLKRAIWHFIGQTLARVPRYRIYLIMYGGLGLSIVAAAILRLFATGQRVEVRLSADGMRAAIPLIAFWTVAGLRLVLVSPGNQRGGWIFRVIKGKPGLEQLLPGKCWVLMWALAITVGAYGLLRIVAPAELLGWNVTVSELIVAIGICFLLTDLFFLQVRVLPFTGEQAAGGQHQLAATLLKYFSALPVVIVLPVLLESEMERSGVEMGVAVVLIAGAHVWLRGMHRRMVREHIEVSGPYDEEDGVMSPLGLGNG